MLYGGAGLSRATAALVPSSSRAAMRRLALLLLALAYAAPALAQSVHGTITDEASGSPVAGAAVSLLLRGDVMTTATSDSAGSFMLFPRRAGSYTLRITHPFFAPVDSAVLTLERGETLVLAVKLGRQAVPLQPILVAARTETRLAEFHERLRLRPGNGQYVTRAMIDARPGARTTDLLRELPGVAVTSVARGSADELTPIGTPDPSMPRATRIALNKTTGYCLPAVFVDGLQVRQYSNTSLDDFIRPEMLEGAEVYPLSSGAPPGMVDPSGCGVVAFWTRSGAGGKPWSWARAAGGASVFVLLVLLTR